METNTKKQWEEYVANEKARVAPFLAARGFVLDEEQPQTIGERYLTRPVGGGRKVVFFGRAKDGSRVVIKTSNEARGIEELEFERRTKAMLDRIRFAYQAFSLPKEILFDSSGILITEYIEQDKPFLDRELKEQFAIALEAFKAQESAHATTQSHWSALRRVMESGEYYIKPGEYRKIGAYAGDIMGVLSRDNPMYDELDAALNRAIESITDGEETLERYDGFLTHWDFVPQNFRIRNGTLYLLDHSSIRFGNKYEGWARFINFMELYNPPLAGALVEYVRLNRAPEELESLRLMRIYRVVELIRYYSTWLPRTEGNLYALTEGRIQFWTRVLICILDNQKVPSESVAAYKKTRDALRSEDEKARQQGLH